MEHGGKPGPDKKDQVISSGKTRPAGAPKPASAEVLPCRHKIQESKVTQGRFHHRQLGTPAVLSRVGVGDQHSGIVVLFEVV